MLLSDSKFTGAFGEQKNNSSLRPLATSAFFEGAPILNYLQFYKMIGNADKIRKKATNKGGRTRAINSPFPEPTPVDIEYADMGAFIFGDKIISDKELEVRGQDISSEHVRQVVEFFKSLGRDFQDRFINSTSSATTWKGIRALMPSAQKVVYDASGDGIIPHADSQQNKAKQRRTLEELENLISMVDGGAELLMMDFKTRSRIKSIGRDFISTTTIKDVIGVEHQFDAIFNVPILLGGKNKDGNLVISHDKTYGTGEGSRTGCTDIFALSFGERDKLAAATNVGVRIEGPEKRGIFFETDCNLTFDMQLVNDGAIAQMTGIKIV
jgi:hypothetical protein